MSRDAYGHLCTVTGAVWQLNGSNFDGVDDIISLPLSFDTLTDLTLEAWINNPLDGDSVGMVWGFYKDATHRIGIFTDRTGGAITAELYIGSVKDVSSDAAPVADTWYHVVVLLGTGGIKMYVDTVAQADTDTSTLSFADIAGMTEAQLGKYVVADTANVWKGKIGEARLYSRRLSVVEITHNYGVTKWRYR